MLSPLELLSGTGTVAGRIFWYARFPRTMACLLAGAALSAAGCVIQNVLANPLASPNIIGVNAGAGLAVTVCCAFGAVSGWIIAGAAFGGAFAAVLLVSLAAKMVGASRTTVILAGVAVNAFLGAVSDAVTNLVPDAAVLSSDFRVGGFGGVVSARLIPAGVLIVLALGAVFALHNELEILSLGEDTARSLGMNAARMRTLFLALAALLCGAAVSFAGLLGFVGLIVPHAVRRFAGNECRRLLPLCALWGGAFVTVCDLMARLLFRPQELPVGILLSALGGPFFLYILSKRGGRSDG
ncbi:MAG: iron ABC transporter permease [Ruminococcaceae bacterium]|nr:iron ABC transporter permease [Oscillospiraceae bacterium]